ncbi:intermediate filament family protein [Naumannella cuiyingiana]|uniref:DNA repair exonuclease SbcCD ATPase subunit n=1 Tax=Naumannella cuiyingiana TaxID=1347891 RepID=A0A7Z0ILE4_9ACTN|nr:hypothetical protein [Naumannella cuiyingiana]NYI71437.1 DNA repair exonuclease SbcCD ATPase subunit [Naumannella cuiyingiana]
MSTPRNSAPAAIRWTALVVLAAGAILAAVAAIGEVWVVRAGVAIAIIAGAAALWLAARQARAALKRSADASREAIRTEVAARSAERKDAREVLDTMSAYNDELAASNDRLEDQRRRAHQEITGLKRRIGSLQSEVSGLRGNNTALKIELADRIANLEALQDALVAKEAELAEMRGEEPGPAGAVLAIAAAPATDEDGDEEHPTVANMAAVKDAEREAAQQPRAREA